MSALVSSQYSYSNDLLKKQAPVREGVCLSEAERTLATEKNAKTVENMVGQCAKAIPREKLEKDYDACAAAEKTWYEKNRPVTGKYNAEYAEKINEGWKGFNENCLEEARNTFKSCRVSINDSSAKRPDPVEVPDARDGGITDVSDRLREREPIKPLDERVPRTDSSKVKKDQSRTLSREPMSGRDPISAREPLQRVDERVPRAEGSSDSRRRRANDESRTSREPLSEREPMQRIDDRVLPVEPTRDSRRAPSPEELALEARRRAAADDRAARDQRAGTGAVGRDVVVPEVAPVTDADLPNCYVLSSTESTRYYGCRNTTAFENCLVVVKRDSSVTCKLVSKD